MMSVNTFGAMTLTKRHDEAIMAPAIVTARQPYLLTKEDEIGPGKKKQAKKESWVRLKLRQNVADLILYIYIIFLCIYLNIMSYRTLATISKMYTRFLR